MTVNGSTWVMVTACCSLTLDREPFAKEPCPAAVWLECASFIPSRGDPNQSKTMLLKGVRPSPVHIVELFGFWPLQIPRRIHRDVRRFCSLSWMRIENLLMTVKKMYFSKLGFQLLYYWLWQKFLMRNLLSDCRLEIMNIAGESQQLLHARYMFFLSFSLVACPLCVMRRLGPWVKQEASGTVKHTRVINFMQTSQTSKWGCFFQKEHGEITEWEMSVSMAYSCNLGLGKCVDYIHEWLTLSHQYRTAVTWRKEIKTLPLGVS